jgi:hypothetical protein
MHDTRRVQAINTNCCFTFQCRESKGQVRIESRKFAGAVVMRFFAKQEQLLYAVFRSLNLLLIHKSSRIVIKFVELASVVLKEERRARARVLLRWVALLRNHFKNHLCFEEKARPWSRQLCNPALLSRFLEAAVRRGEAPPFLPPFSASLRIMFGLLDMTTTLLCVSQPPTQMRCFSHLNGGQYWGG